MSLKLDGRNYQEASLEAYQAEIIDIWPLLASRPALHTWARVVQHATTACEGMRRDDWQIVIKEIAKVNIWWLAFIAKLNLLCKNPPDADYDDDLVFALPLTPTKLIWRKYPHVCPVEFGLAAPGSDLAWAERPAQVCACLGRKREVEKRSQEEKRAAKDQLQEFSERHISECPSTIVGLEKMFRCVFSGPIHALTFQELSFHFIEEIGEVSEALAEATFSECLSEPNLSDDRLVAERKRKVRAIAEELADVWSWSVSIVAKVQEHFITFEQYLETRHDTKELEEIRKLLKGSQHLITSEIIWQEYGLQYGELRCHDCHKRPCQCAQQRAQPLDKEAFRAMSRERRLALLAANEQVFRTL